MCYTAVGRHTLANRGPEAAQQTSNRQRISVLLKTTAFVFAKDIVSHFTEGMHQIELGLKPSVTLTD